MIHISKNEKGFSLVEIILAVSIFSLCITGLSGGLIYGQQSSLIATHRAQAVFLANEGLSATENIANESFSNIIDGTFGLKVSNNVYIHDGIYDIWDIYERRIIISSIDANTKKVESEVSWHKGFFDEGRVSLITYVTNWR